MGKVFMQPMRIPPAQIIGWNATFMKVQSAPLPMDLEIPFENITLLHALTKYLLIVYCVLDMVLGLGSSVGD